MTRTDVELDVLHLIALAMMKPTNLEQSITDALKALNEHTGMERVTVTLFDPLSQEIRIEYAHGLSESEKKKGFYKIGEGITGTVVQTGEPVVVPRIDQDPRFLDRTRSRSHIKDAMIGFICTPIKFANQTIGTLSADIPYKTAPTFQAELRLLNIVSSMIAQAVDGIREMQEERRQLMDENIKLRHQLQERYHVEGVIGNSSKMREALELVQQVAPSQATVLIRGETGTGKELIAQAIHYNSPRAEHPFVKINCAALPESLLESELFGYVKGAFTGATAARKGRFQQAHRGTIFLDEIGDLSPSLQVKLLRVLQFKEFEPLGSDITVKVDVRILAATSRQLEELVGRQLYREDLYYRINVFPIFMPPLRDRKGDIVLLADHFLVRYSQLNHKRIHRISTPAIDMLVSYHWPGNVRELENCIERAVLVCQGDVIRAEHLPPSLQTAKSAGSPSPSSMTAAVENLEREMILEALKSNHGHQGQAARALGVTMRMLGYKIRKYAIDPRAYSGRAAADV